MDTQDIARESIARFNKRITNEIFLGIQNDRDLMKEYLEVVHERGVATVNRDIGKKVKKAYHLENMNDRDDNPSCTLIQSHQKFE